jgi:hypothetical protein
MKPRAYENYNSAENNLPSSRFGMTHQLQFPPAYSVFVFVVVAVVVAVVVVAVICRQIFFRDRFQKTRDI